VLLQVIKGQDNSDLSITKTASPRSGESGTVFTFTIVVTPSGGDVENVIVTDPIPSQLTNAKLLTTFGGGWPAKLAGTSACRRTYIISLACW
jgi:uncharacterized repeat protein (TIGR01451 family)